MHEREGEHQSQIPAKQFVSSRNPHLNHGSHYHSRASRRGPIHILVGISCRVWRFQAVLPAGIANGCSVQAYVRRTPLRRHTSRLAAAKAETFHSRPMIVELGRCRQEALREPASRPGVQGRSTARRGTNNNPSTPGAHNDHFFTVMYVNCVVFSPSWFQTLIDTVSVPAEFPPT